MFELPDEGPRPHCATVVDGARCGKPMVVTLFTGGTGWGACLDHATERANDLARASGSHNIVRWVWNGCHICDSHTVITLSFALDDSKYATRGTAPICDPDDNDCLAWYGVEAGR